MAVKTFIEAIRETLAEEMRRDESIIVLGEDVGKKGGVFLATDGLWDEFGDDRVIDTPLTESMIVGVSIGAAVERAAAGRRDPVRRLHLSRRSTRSCPRRRGCATARTTRFGCPMTIRAPVRRRRPRRAVPLAVGRGVLHPRARA